MNEWVNEPKQVWASSLVAQGCNPSCLGGCDLPGPYSGEPSAGTCEGRRTRRTRRCKGKLKRGLKLVVFFILKQGHRKLFKLFVYSLSLSLSLLCLQLLCAGPFVPQCACLWKSVDTLGWRFSPAIKVRSVHSGRHLLTILQALVLFIHCPRLHPLVP